MSKLTVGLKHYFKPTPAKIKRFLLAWKTIIAGSAFTAMADSDWKLAIVIGIVGFAVNEACEFLGNKELFPEEMETPEVKEAAPVREEEYA